jgi:hypothetical protein
MKKAQVFSNDPANSRIQIGLTAHVKSAIRVSNRYVSLYVSEGKKVTRVVQIEGMLGKPLALKPVEFSLPAEVIYSIEEVEEGRKFRIHFANVPGKPHKFRGHLKLKTSYPEKPIIILKINGRIDGNKVRRK